MIVRPSVKQAVQISGVSPLAGGSGCCTLPITAKRLGCVITVIRPPIRGKAHAEIDSKTTAMTLEEN